MQHIVMETREPQSKCWKTIEITEIYQPDLVHGTVNQIIGFIVIEVDAYSCEVIE